jgi:hypothetical protein
MTSADAVRLARAAALLDRRRARLDELSAVAAGLDQLDVIVVDGERAVLAELAAELDRARTLVAGLAAGTADAGTLDRIEAIAGAHCWTVLDDVRGLLTDKALIAENARTQVQPRLQDWEEVMARVERAGREIQARHLHVVEPWELAVGRHRMTALMRQARTAARNGQLLDVWRALNRLDADPSPTADGRKPLPARRVPDELDAVTERARLSAGRLQLIALRGSTDESRVEYTLMLSAPAADRQVGINVEDRSTLVRRNHQEFLDVTRAAVTGSYRALRDVVPAAGAGADDDAGDRMAALRDMGQTLYRLLIPNRLKDEIDRHPEVPLIVVTNDREISWELMYADDFVALQRPVARMPVGRFGSRRGPQPAHGRRRRKVALVASAGGEIELTGAVREVERIAEGLTAAWGEDVEIHRHVTGTRSPASGRSFDALLKSPDYDIVHYAGHAVYDRRRPDQSGLLLDHGEPCTAEKIHRLLAGSPLVFLNACETARLRQPAEAPPDGTYEGDPKEGLASAFLYGGALACIGNSWPVPDTVAADFAIAFYRWALDGRPLGEAMRYARQETARRWPEDPSWASFVLYGDPGFHLGPFASWDTGTATT